MGKKKPTEEEVLAEMKRLAANGITECTSRLLSDKLGFEDADKGRNVVRRLMKKLEAEGKIRIESKAVQGKRKRYFYKLASKKEKA